MKISLISDCHFEFYQDPKLFLNTSNADVLVIAGDLAVGKEAVVSALKQFANNYEKVFFTSGNHEYYGSTIAEVDHYISDATRDSNIYFINPGSVVIDGVALIGSNLWTNFRKDAIAKFACSRSINDFNRIHNFTTDQCSVLHTDHFKYIREAYAKYPDHKKVIVTHFLPAVECIAEEWRNDGLLNYYFANDYGQLISEMSNTIWLFGHTHSNIDVMLGDTRCVANPYGYNYNKSYKECIIEV